jgi:type I pantothenate kinase
MDTPPTALGAYRAIGVFAGLDGLLRDLPKATDAALIADVLAECATPGQTLVVGVTGSVAAGKTTFCASIAARLRGAMRLDIISTDGFLHTNETLSARGPLMRKGYPESYDLALMSGVLQRARWGPVSVPGYSHTTYDRAPDLDRTVDRPDILIVEGLGFSPSAGQLNPAALLDLLIYIDATEEDLETWFLTRFMAFCEEARTNPASFYARFAGMPPEAVDTFARHVWQSINLPNLREHISTMTRHADIVISKARDHSMRLNVPAGASDS